MSLLGNPHSWHARLVRKIRRNMLRTRFILGLVSLAIILGAMATYSIRSTRNLAGTVSAITTANFDMLRILQEAKVAGTSLSYALVLANDGQKIRARNMADRQISKLERALEDFRGNPEFSRFEVQSNKFRESAIRAIDYSRIFLDFDRPSIPGDTLFTYLGGVLVSMSENATDLERRFVNQVSVTAERSVNTATDTQRFVIIAVLLALLGSLYVSWQLVLWILQPIRILATQIQRISQGNYGQQVPIASGDELGLLAGAFNRMSTRLKQYAEQTSDRIMVLQRTIHKTFASFPHPIFIVNSAQGMDYRNPAADRFLESLGYDGGEPVLDFLNRYMEQKLNVASDYVPESLNDALTFRVGQKERHYLPRVLQLRDAAEPDMGMAIVLDDITSMRLVDGIKSNLISTVSHEIKNPLTTLRMATHLLIEQNVGTLNERQAALAEMIREESERMLMTLNDLLELARIDHSDQIINREQCNIREMIQTVIDENCELAQLRGMIFEVALDEGLERVLADQRVVRHILRNYVSNACKYATIGKITVSARRSGNHLRFSVTDEGPGIPAEHHEKLFHRFWRIPGEAKQGTGLGLAIVKQMAESHGGRVGLESTQKGSIFWFDLPLDQ